MMTYDDLKAVSKETAKLAATCRLRKLIVWVLMYLSTIRSGAYDIELTSIGLKANWPDDSEPVRLLEEALKLDSSVILSQAAISLLRIANTLSSQGSNLMAGHYRYLGRSIAMREIP